MHAIESRFTIGLVMRDSLRTYQQHFFKIALIGIVTMILLVILLVPLAIFMPAILLEVYLAFSSGEGTGTGLILYGVMFTVIFFLVILLIAYIPFGIIATGTVQALTTGRFQLGRAIGLGVRRLIPMIASGLLLMLPLIVGFLLVSAVARLGGWSVLVSLPVFVGATIYFVLCYWMAAPVTVIEERGPIESLYRSAQLTRGRRGALFGLLLVTVIMNWLLIAAFQLVLGGSEDIISGILALLAIALLNALWPVVTGAAYYRLRMEKEGPDTEQLAEVFA